jgi:hypothetical protein
MDEPANPEKPRPFYLTLTGMQRRILMLVLVFAFFYFGGPRKLSEAVSASAGWDAEAQREYDAQIDLNRKYLRAAEEMDSYWSGSKPGARQAAVRRAFAKNAAH